MSTAAFQRFSNSLGEKYEPFVRHHLAQVYMVLGFATLSSAVGILLNIANILDTGILAAVGSLVTVLALHFYRDNGKNYYGRLGMLLGFGFFSGQTLGPLIQYIISVNPTIVFTALMGTVITFASLSLSALLAERGKFLFLGGILVSVINTMALISLLNIFFRSYFVQLSQLYIGVFVMAAFVLYDTQNIVEKCRMGNRDTIQHALDLFFDVLSMFRRLLIILTHKEERKNEKKRNQH